MNPLCTAVFCASLIGFGGALGALCVVYRHNTRLRRENFSLQYQLWFDRLPARHGNKEK